MVDPKIIRNLVPINNLNEHNLERFARRLEIETLPPDTVICKQGDTEPETIFLISGSVSVGAHGTTMRRMIVGGTEEARYPLADQLPRPHTLASIDEVQILRVDNYKLDRAVMLDEVTTIIVGIENEPAKQSRSDSDWMTEMLESDAFRKVPSDKIAPLLQRLTPIKVRAGDVIVRQGEQGDYYYIVREGKFVVSRKDTNGKVAVLNELTEGNVFGEESLLSGEARNASVVATADGTLMRLGKADFEKLLKEPLLSYVTVDDARVLVKVGAKVLDVRPEIEFKRGALKGSINVPVYALRDRLGHLEQGVRYIVCCRNGIQSEIAAFMLSQRGFDVSVLKGGLESLPKKM
jgi:CRP-like cAMP-binding protein/rhodanese-related sulfurtransferase